jgi:hypothetical protein
MPAHEARAQLGTEVVVTVADRFLGGRELERFPSLWRELVRDGRVGIKHSMSPTEPGSELLSRFTAQSVHQGAITMCVGQVDAPRNDVPDDLNHIQQPIRAERSQIGLVCRPIAGVHSLDLLSPSPEILQSEQNQP